MIRNPQLILKQSSDINEETLRALIDDILQLDKTNIPTGPVPTKASGNELQDLRDQIAILQKLIADKPAAPTVTEIQTVAVDEVVPTEVVDLTSPEAEDKTDEIISDPAPEAEELSKDK